MNAVEFQGVSKSYAIYDAPGDRLKELLTLNRVKRHRDFWALHDVSFEVKRGETFCVVGQASACWTCWRAGENEKGGRQPLGLRSCEPKGQAVQ